MKQLWVMVFVLSFVFVLAGCGDNPSTRESIAPTGSVEVLRNVFDDQQSTAYIRVDDPRIQEADTAVAEIMMKKKNWENQFPDKKIVAMSVVTGDGGGYGTPIVFGLLIHYEWR